MKLYLSYINRPGFRLAMFAACASLFAFSSNAQDERGKQLYTNCVACHGADGAGNKLLNAPAISGLSAKYISEQFKKFKLGHRGGDPRDASGLQMRPMAMLVNGEEDIAAVSKYVASLESKPHAATIEGGDPEKGKMLYMACQACHQADGSGNDLLNSPSLIHQHDWYLAAQLDKFKSGVRGSNPEDITGSQMRPMSMTLADEQAVKDVVAYIQSLSK